jgi:ParB family transcriptional regulator, chromosome partitioning protein
MSKSSKTEPHASGVYLFIPLDRLMKSPDNVRKTPHSAATLDGLRASIAAKGILQNLIVRPERSDDGAETGFYYVTAGEGRRLAQVARAKAGEIAVDTPMPCVIRCSDDAQEVSLDENVTREAMHPADQFEAFRALNVERGMDVADIAARFGVTEHTVRQRLRLGAVSPRLMQAYRDEELNLSQLMAFAITEDHARQESVFDRLTGYRDPYHIRRWLTEGQVMASDRRARFVGEAAYVAAGGQIERDLFTEEGGGYYTEPALLDTLVTERFQTLATDLQGAEGWKWSEVHIDFPYASGFGRVYPQPRELSPEDAAALDAAQSSYDALEAEYEGVEDLPDDIDRRLGALESEIERLDALKAGYTPEDIARGGLIVSLSHEGTARIERGLIRAEDEAPEPEVEDETADSDDKTAETDLSQQGGGDDDEDEPEDTIQPLSDALLRDLTTHRTLALRLTLGEQPERAARVLAHKLALDTFYRTADQSCLELTARSTAISSFAEGLDETPTASALSQRHTAWAATLPEKAADLWDYVLTVDPETLGALMAHCVALTVHAVRQPHGSTGHIKAAEKLAQQLQLDMDGHWRPTARSYFGRVNKGQILLAVREAVGEDAAARLTKLKKAEMADCAEQLMVGTGWLPASLRTAPRPDAAPVREILHLPAPEPAQDAAPVLSAAE